ncbi:MAG: hypothetical protein WDO16_24255 [Bacteroidota bacterium]
MPWRAPVRQTQEAYSAFFALSQARVEGSGQVTIWVSSLALFEQAIIIAASRKMYNTFMMSVV